MNANASLLDEALALMLSEGLRTVDLLDRLWPSAIQELSELYLIHQGVVLEGHPSVIEFARAEMRQKVEKLLDGLDTASRAGLPGAGRRRVPIERDILVAAAFLRFRHSGMGPVASRRAAARLLGSTISIVDKGARRYFIRAWLLERLLRSEHAHTVQAVYFIHAQRLLAQCAANRGDAKRRAEIHRRDQLFRRV